MTKQEQLRKAHGIKTLSLKESAAKTKDLPKAGQKMNYYNEALKRKIINKGHDYLRD